MQIHLFNVFVQRTLTVRLVTWNAKVRLQCVAAFVPAGFAMVTTIAVMAGTKAPNSAVGLLLYIVLLFCFYREFFIHFRMD